MLISGCKNPFMPRLDNCSAHFHQGASTRGTLIVDGEMKFINNFMPGDNFDMLHLDDGTIHTYRFYATDPRVFDTGTRSFKVQMNKTHAYDGINYNAVIIIGGATYDSVAPDTLETS
jgi:hypothetical protein